MDPNPTNWWPPPLRANAANGRTADGRTDSSSFPFPFLKISLSPVRCSGRLPPRVLSVGPAHMHEEGTPGPPVRSPARLRLDCFGTPRPRHVLAFHESSKLPNKTFLFPICSALFFECPLWLL